MMIQKYHPLRKGYNEALGYYEKSNSVSDTPKRKCYMEINSQPEAIKAKSEASISSLSQYSITFNI